MRAIGECRGIKVGAADGMGTPWMRIVFDTSRGPVKISMHGTDARDFAAKMAEALRDVMESGWNLGVSDDGDDGGDAQ